MTDQSFYAAINTAGGYFLLLYGETVLDWTGSNAELVEVLHSKGHDKNLSGTQARVTAIKRLIREDRFADALKKVRDSDNITRKHPETYQLASDLLRRRFPNR